MSMGWIKPLRTKGQALPATKEFIKYVQNQHSASIKGWMSNAGGEYKLKAFRQLMHNQGIHVYESAPHTPQQAKRLHACLPDSYWEFAVQHAVHVYNCTPKQGLNWRTPHELIYKAPPTVSHLYVFWMHCLCAPTSRYPRGQAAAQIAANDLLGHCARK